MISAISWVPKGIAKSIPSVAEPPSKEEIEEIIKSGALEARHTDHEEEDEDMEDEVDKEVDEVAHASAVAEMLGNASADIADALKELDMENYDDEDDGIQLFNKDLGDSYYPSCEMDPYLKGNDDEDSEEEEDMIIKPDDLVIVCARNEDDISQLEVYILDEAEDGSPNLFVHHDVIISDFPLSTAWLDCPLKVGEKGNFVAVGSMEPSIEIWDLDIIDEVQPCLVLGGIAEKKKKGKKKSIKYKEDSHTDSVLGLAWNKEFRNILASASADNTVKLWDVATGKCSMTMDHHKDKVQAVAWNRHVPEILLSGSFDHSVVLKDGRKPSHSGYKWAVDTDVECLEWDPHTEHSFVVSLENGMIQGFDIRTASSDPESKQKPSYTLHAHDKAVCTVSYNPAAPNLLATGSTDKMVKLWDLSNNQPSCVSSRNPKAEMRCLPHCLAASNTRKLIGILWEPSFQFHSARTCPLCLQLEVPRGNYKSGMCYLILLLLRNTATTSVGVPREHPSAYFIGKKVIFSITYAQVTWQVAHSSACLSFCYIRGLPASRYMFA